MAERNTSDLATLLAQALGTSAEERQAFVDRVCGDNAGLRRDLNDLLDANERAGDFLHKAAVPTGALRSSAAEPMGGLPQEDVGTRIGPYKILQLIGEGGFGSVYMAEQEHPVRRRVALKVIKLGMDTRQVIARFEAERQALAIMDHPNIAHVFDAGATDTGRPFFVMELVKGEPITEYCDRHRLSIEARLHLFRQVCAAVQHAHQKGVIHRDLKPSNVLVTLHDGNPLPKVIDFGIAKATSSRLTEKTLFTEFRQMIGTPEYMSPEQAEANATDIDTRSDVYSLGVLLYELLTGATPFDGRRLRSAAFGELQRIIREEEPPRPSTRLSTMESLPTVASQRAVEPARLRTEVRGDLDWIVMRAIEKDRTRRYASASALADDIDRHLAHEPVQAGPASATYRARKFVRRHRAQVIAVSLIALALVGGSIGTLVGMLRARDSALLARDEADKARAVNQFMSEVLTSVDPDERGADVRLMEVMDDASRTASQRFAEHPELEAQVRQTLARVYGRLTNKAARRNELKKALEIWRRLGGPDDRRALATHLDLIGHYVGYEDTAQAEAALAEVSPRVLKVWGPESPQALEMRRLDGMIGMLRGRYDQAEAILLDVRDRVRATGDDDGLQLDTLEGLVRIHRRRFNESNDKDHDETALVTMQPLIRESIERSSRVYGPDALSTLDARLRLADIEWQLGKCHSAVETCRAILERTEGRYTECHQLRQYAKYVLSFALNCLGESREPADLWLARIECRRQSDSQANDPVFLGVISDSLRFLERDNRGPEGEALARELVDALRSLGGGHHAMVLASEIHVASFISMQGRFQEADGLFASLIARPAQDDEVEVRARLHMLFARHLTRQGRFEESEQALRAAVTFLPDLLRGTYDSHPDDMILAHIELYEAWNKPDRVAEYRGLLRQLDPYSTGATQPAK